jgi:hypothetical protein
MRRRVLGVTFVLLALVAAGACSDDGDGDGDESGGGDTTSTTAGDAGAGDGGAGASALVFNGQGNDLDVYDGAPPFETQKLITHADADPEGRDINAQICFFDPGGDASGETWFIAGEDTNQPDPPAGWGIFRVEGDAVGSLSWEQIGKLTPTYQPEGDPENYGCGVLSDGRIVTTDLGNQALGAGTGQLIMWFPPFDSYEVRYCKLDVDVATGQSIWIDGDDNIFVASSRGDEDEAAGVYRFSGPFPTGNDAESGCGSTDSTGAPMADEVTEELWIETSDATGLLTPAGLAPTPAGGLYVSSVFNGVINEYDADGEFVRTILQPDEGTRLGPEPLPTGTPLGIGVGPDGTLYFADIGLVVEAEGELPGPGNRTGTVRRIVFTDGEPGEPETMATGLAFPDGIGIYAPGRVGGSGSSVLPPDN